MSPADVEQRTSLSNSPPRYVMIGGFLGSGKTTAIAALAQRLSSQGLRVGLITNDQGQNLVDTALLRSRGFPTQEIPGGCFCCRFDSLVDAAKKLTAQARPDIFIAEPVGSCTDLIATVTYPLRRMYGQDFTVAPVSVMVDPLRAQRVFGLVGGRSFSDRVLYIYQKQLEEADIIVINKQELLAAAELKALQSTMAARFAGKQVLTVSSRNGSNLETWFERILSESQPSGRAMLVDYQTYAEGEALLGWLNCTVELTSDTAFNANSFLEKLASAIQSALAPQAAEIAHLKMTLTPQDAIAEIAVINLVRNDFEPELSQRLDEPVKAGQLIINLRAEAAPELLSSAVEQALAGISNEFPHVTTNLNHLEHFRPGKPTPTHRFAEMPA